MKFMEKMRRSFAGNAGAAGHEQKASATAGLSPGYAGHSSAWLTLGAPSWGPRSYAGLTQAGYAQNVVAHRAVKLVAECAASVPVIAQQGGRQVQGHPLQRLLQNPNPMMGAQDLLEQIYTHLLLAGNAYVERVDAPSGRASELYALRPDRMRVIPGTKGWPRAYDYEVAGKKHRFPVHQMSGRSAILHLKSLHPLDDHYGLPALEAAAKGIDIHNAASAWNKALLDNAARPSGALVFEPSEGVPGNLTEEQIASLKADMEAQFQGAANAGRPLLLEGGLKWQQMAFSPADMDFIAAKNVSAREIALAFGVPPMLLGIPGDNTYANYQEANRAFWRLTLLPLVEKTLGRLGRWLGENEGEARPQSAAAGGFIFVPDKDAITALAPEREALWARLQGASFLTANEKRAAIGLPPVEEGDALVGPFGAGRRPPGPFEERGLVTAFVPAPGRETRHSGLGAKTLDAKDTDRFSGAEEAADLTQAPEMDTLYVKVWRTAKDGKVRETHMAADGQVRFLDEPFQIGTVKLMAPRDPDGPPEETINCRCEMEQVLFSDLGVGDQALLRRKRPELFKPKEEPKKPRAATEGPGPSIVSTVLRAHAGLIEWGQWVYLDGIAYRDNRIRYEFSMTVEGNAPSAFEVQIEYWNEKDEKVRELVANPGSFSIVVGGGGGSIGSMAQVRFRIRSYAMGQIVRVLVVRIG